MQPCLFGAYNPPGERNIWFRNAFRFNELFFFPINCFQNTKTILQHKCICGLQNTLIIKKSSSSSVTSLESLDLPVFCYSQCENEVLLHGHEMAVTTLSITSSHSSFPKGRNPSFTREKEFCQKLPVELLLKSHWPELGHVSTTNPVLGSFGNELEFPQITWTNCDSYAKTEHIAFFFRRTKAGRECLLGKNK